MNNVGNADKTEEIVYEKTKKLFDYIITSDTFGYFTNIKTLFLIATIYPLISSDAERVFSLSSLIHDAIRNQLTVEHVKLLITVNMFGGDFDDFDSTKILYWWVVTKRNTKLYEKINLMSAKLYVKQ